jgi:GT2 family glycosyltransferase
VGVTSTLDVAVAISTKGRPEALRRCLASLRAGMSLPVEVWVADQSEDESPARAVVEEAAGVGLAVRHLRARRGGLGVAQNDAVRATTAKVVAVLDDDCLADAAWIREIGRVFAADPDLALLGGRVLPLGPPLPGMYPVSSRISTEPRSFAGRAAPWNIGSGNNFALRRSWFLQIGGCNEQLGPGAPLKGGLDMDLFYRILRAGGRARYEPAVLVFHERTTREERLARRTWYGFGMAAAISLWLRERDAFALRVLGSWLLMRGALLIRAGANGRWSGVHEELLVLGGTVRGLIRGLTTPRQTQAPNP